MTRLPSLVTSKLPILQLPELITTILQHSSKMKQIERDYSLAKQEMHYSYELEKTKLEQNLEQFKSMAKLTKKQFEYGHIERMQILQSVKTISQTMGNLQDSHSIESFKETIHLLLGSYQQSIVQVKSVESNQNKLIGR